MAVHDSPFLPAHIIDAPKSDEEPIRLIQITDCHLGETAGEKLVGMDTDESLDHILAMIRDEQCVDAKKLPNLVIVTGDIANHGSPNAYVRFQEKLSVLSMPSVWLPGNHDDWSIIKSAVDSRFWPRSVQLGNWHIFLLDSTLPKEVGGTLGDDELRNLANALAAIPTDAHVAIALHHQPIAVGCEWLDQQRIADSEEFLALLSGDERIKAVFWGHVHQDFEGSVIAIESARFFSTPSTCVQFRPNSKDFSLDETMPAYRWIDLYASGKIETGVSRLENVLLDFDRSSSGY